MNKQEKITINLKEAVVTGIVIDIFLLIVSGLIMDGGQIARITLYLVVGHWTGNALIILRRKSKMTKMDRDFIRFGLIILAVAATFIVFLSEILLVL